MTNATNIQTAAPSFAAEDPRTQIASAIRIARGVVAGVRPDQMDLPTPCANYNVRHLLGHLGAVFHRIAAVGRGEHAFSVPQIMEAADDTWPATFAAGEADVWSVWTNDALLNELMVMPWAQMPGFALIGMYTNEISVHTWDLATATGQTVPWDDAVLTAAFATIQMAMPAEGRRTPLPAELVKARAAMEPDGPDATRPGTPFGDVVEVGADAPLIDRLVAWNGRTPQA